MNDDNRAKIKRKIKSSKARACFGHLELNGYQVYKGFTQEHGASGDKDIFDKFEKVYTGHYHTRSNDGRVYYLGNPYEMFWGDVNDTERGFHIWDTDTFEHTPVNNPYRLHHIVYYKDTDYQLFDARDLENKIVKVIVRQKSDITKFEKFIDKLYAANVAELKVVENFAIRTS